MLMARAKRPANAARFSLWFQPGGGQTAPIHAWNCASVRSG